VALTSISALILIAIAHRSFPDQASHLLDKLIHSLHGPGFVGVALFVFAILRIYHRGVRNYWYAAAISMAVGLFAEASQIPGPRDAEVSDLFVDAIGIGAALGMLALFDRDMRHRLTTSARVVLVGGTCLALMFSLAPSTWYAYALVSQHQAMPALLTFEHTWEKSLHSNRGSGRIRQLDAPTDWPIDGSVLQVTSSSRGGLLLWRPYPDWSGFSALSFLAMSVDASTRDALIFIEDTGPEGRDPAIHYRTTFEIGPTPRRIRIPLDAIRATTEDRPFDIAHVNFVFLRLSERMRGAVVIFDDFRLE
jgi:VanZ family protein